MYVLRGPIKVDVIFSLPNTPSPPWVPGPSTLPLIDQHFWDWTLWLGSKVLRRSEDTVRTELEKMQWYLLGPLGSLGAPGSLSEAVAAYLELRAQATSEFLVAVPEDLGEEVIQGLQRHGVLTVD
jgi:hypothetical protein